MATDTETSALIGICTDCDCWFHVDDLYTCEDCEKPFCKECLICIEDAADWCNACHDKASPWEKDSRDE